jgi:hypothetical protein
MFEAIAMPVDCSGRAVQVVKMLIPHSLEPRLQSNARYLYSGRRIDVDEAVYAVMDAIVVPFEGRSASLSSSRPVSDCGSSRDT